MLALYSWCVGGFAGYWVWLASGTGSTCFPSSAVPLSFSSIAWPAGTVAWFPGMDRATPGVSKSRGTAMPGLASPGTGPVPDTAFVRFAADRLGPGDLGAAAAADWEGFIFCGLTVDLAVAFFLALALAVARLARASFSSACARTSLASASSRLASRACFLARRAACLASLRRRLARRACSWADSSWLSALASRMRAS